ncbi:radical SAM family heme chaperone HemW [Acaryochloris sp. CCMEE 5410]|uniref:radical SAM family heme chaperone HemW n=1 Tax=Acaryochloris sp. CCMEE 5410 TaxID=310037 RepID=UPI0002483E20|nr:radical SAM family heme chaperone HemW [Acaryochloris sp. CCMEE 5410]KAI9131152.1 coproporphyrinogen III oxidase [Acaryochloris sp. CCMEE 5410]
MKIAQPAPIASAWPTSAYIHIPFCRRRCFYCDFPISVIGDRKRGETSLAIADYVDLLCEEIEITASGPHPLKTIFFGGGTPSLLSALQLEQILQCLEQQFGLEPDIEISIEMDPGTFSWPLMRQFKTLGITRVSLGVQAFTEELLQVCGRSHTVTDIDDAIAILHQAGITNFGLDLISGLPNQTLDQWQANLEAALALEPTHLSTYDLVIEPTTVFGKKYQPGMQPLPSDETAAQMYRLAATTLTAAGYDHYEISNYARPGYTCRHNQVYWRNNPYYGFGMGATSYVHGQRVSRPRTRKAYADWVKRLIATQGQMDDAVSSDLDILLETLMMGLRLATGVSLSTLQDLASPQIVDTLLQCLAPYQEQGWLQLPHHPEEAICLTDPDGFLFSNTILTTIWQALDP